MSIKTYCITCSEAALTSWRGWPLRDSVPMPKMTSGTTCDACGGERLAELNSVSWNNVHGPSSTGLPDYWVLGTTHGHPPSQANDPKWGLPYAAIVTCPRCGKEAVESTHWNERALSCPNCPPKVRAR